MKTSTTSDILRAVKVIALAAFLAFACSLITYERAQAYTRSVTYSCDVTHAGRMPIIFNLNLSEQTYHIYFAFQVVTESFFGLRTSVEKFESEMTGNYSGGIPQSISGRYDATGTKNSHIDGSFRCYL